MSDFEAASDSVLMVSIGRWEEAALAEVYRRHGAAVHHLARRVIASREYADEVTQEVFVDLWRRPEQFDAARGSLRTLLLTKAHGRAVDLVRSESARRAREERVGRDQELGSYDIDHFAWDLSTADQVKMGLDALSGDERRAIEMAYFDGLTYRQVAAELSEPEGTVKSRIRSGLRRLRTVLEQQGVERS